MDELSRLSGVGISSYETIWAGVDEGGVDYSGVQGVIWYMLNGWFSWR